MTPLGLSLRCKMFYQKNTTITKGKEVNRVKIIENGVQDNSSTTKNYIF